MFATFHTADTLVSPPLKSKEVRPLQFMKQHLITDTAKQVVRTQLDSDLKPLQAKSITISIRCYESRLGRVRVLYSNILVDHTQVLWNKPDDRDSAPIGNTEFPFRIAIPANVAGFSTATFVEYRCMWRVEASMCTTVLSIAPN